MEMGRAFAWSSAIAKVIGSFISGSSGIKGGAPKDSCKERELTIRARSNRVNCGIPIVTVLVSGFFVTFLVSGFFVTFLVSGFFVTFLVSGFFVTFLEVVAVFALDLLDNKSQISKALMMVQISITQGNNFVDNFNTIWSSIQ